MSVRRFQMPFVSGRQTIDDATLQHDRASGKRPRAVRILMADGPGPWLYTPRRQSANQAIWYRRCVRLSMLFASLSSTNCSLAASQASFRPNRNEILAR